MKPALIIIFAIVFLSACNNKKQVDLSDPLTTGRGYVEALLKGDYKTAEQYLLKDSTNMEYFQRLKDFNMKWDAETRVGYSTANIIVDSLISESDSVDVLYYTNSYKNKPSKIKLVKQKKDWLVDFKYTFSDN